MFTVGKCGRFMSNNYIWKMWKIHVQQLHMVNVEGSCPTTTYGNLALKFFTIYFKDFNQRVLK